MNNNTINIISSESNLPSLSLNTTVYMGKVRYGYDIYPAPASSTAESSLNSCVYPSSPIPQPSNDLNIIESDPTEWLLDIHPYFRLKLDVEYEELIAYLQEHDPDHLLGVLEMFRVFEPYLEYLAATFDLKFNRRQNNVGRKGHSTLMYIKVFMVMAFLRLNIPQLAERLRTDVRLLMLFNLRLFQGIGVSTLYKYWAEFSQFGLMSRFFDFVVEHCAQSDMAKEWEGHQLLVDSEFQDVPKHHYRSYEYQAVKDGCVQLLLVGQAHRARHLDLDARYTVKNKEKHFGYKTHALVIHGSRFVLNIQVTPANCHDGNENVVRALLHTPMVKGFTTLIGDKAYCGKTIIDIGHDYSLNVQTPHKKPIDGKLAAEDIAHNRQIASYRSHVEHVFGMCAELMGPAGVHGLGLADAKASAYLRITLFNMRRYCCWLHQQSQASQASVPVETHEETQDLDASQTIACVSSSSNQCDYTEALINASLSELNFETTNFISDSDYDYFSGNGDDTSFKAKEEISRLGSSRDESPLLGEIGSSLSLLDMKAIHFRKCRCSPKALLYSQCASLAGI